MVKYGVVETRPLLNDLLGWSHLYISGRMHKPIAMLQGSPQVAEAQTRNLRSALSTALLLLPGAFSTEASGARLHVVLVTRSFCLEVPPSTWSTLKPPTCFSTLSTPQVTLRLLPLTK